MKKTGGIGTPSHPIKKPNNYRIKLLSQLKGLYNSTPRDYNQINKLKKELKKVTKSNIHVKPSNTLKKMGTVAYYQQKRNNNSVQVGKNRP